MLRRLAEVSHMTPEQLREEFGGIVDYEEALA
jgi:hypothetical protein